jgi:hypothetical protein
LPLPAQPRMTIRAMTIGYRRMYAKSRATRLTARFQYAQPALGFSMDSFAFAVIWFRTSQSSL